MPQPLTLPMVLTNAAESLCAGPVICNATEKLPNLDDMMHCESFDVRTQERSQMIEITAKLRQVVDASGVVNGRATVYVPHTTAGITINENADPDVVHDMLGQLEQMVPWTQPFYRHAEGNSASHVKASMMGSSVDVLIDKSQLVLGTWQGIWFCEFDGPRTRRVVAQIEGE